MAACRHRGALEPFFAATGMASAILGWRCLACREYLSQGKANHRGPHAATVAVELRAAEIVASGYWFDHGKLRSMHWYEGCGWDNAIPCDDAVTHALCGDDTEEPEDGPKHLAGFLARCIVTHEEA